MKQHILIPAFLVCLLLCSGCSPHPVEIINDTDGIIGVILIKREPSAFKVTFQKHMYLSAGESEKLWGGHQANYIKLYSKSGLIGIWPAISRDQFTIKKSGGKNKFKVTRDTHAKNFTSIFPVNTYEWTRTPDVLGVYSIWILFMSVLCFFPLALFVFIDRLIRKERSFANELNRNFNKLLITLPLFFVAAIAISFLITWACAVKDIRQQQIFIEKIRTLDAVDAKLLNEKEHTSCNHER